QFYQYPEASSGGQARGRAPGDNCQTAANQQQGKHGEPIADAACPAQYNSFLHPPAPPLNKPLTTGCISQPPPHRCVCALPPPGISPLAWDAGVSTVVGAASIVWVKLWTGLARRDKMKPQVWAFWFAVHVSWLRFG
ncbi:unnamed protein product, partial [Ectocarpus sp. 8 AP-2014]